MTPSQQFGPWAPDLHPAEQLARLRSLRTAARILAGPRAVALVNLLALAEHELDALDAAADALDRLEPLDRRHIVSAYAGAAYQVGTRAQARPFLSVTPRPRDLHRDPHRPLYRRLPGHRVAA